MTTSELQSIVFSGGSIIIDARKYTIASLQTIAFVAKTHEAKVTIKHASGLSVQQCKDIAFSGGGQGIITFDFTE